MAGQDNEQIACLRIPDSGSIGAGVITVPGASSQRLCNKGGVAPTIGAGDAEGRRPASGSRVHHGAFGHRVFTDFGAITQAAQCSNL